MRVSNSSPVDYFLRFNDEEVHLNPYLGRKVSFAFNGQINCISCGKLTPKSFAQGFCFPCMQNSPLNSDCIIRPELCEAHLGKGRDLEWEKENHLQPHTVYLALSSGIKVGVTRNSQVPSRWIDQGATSAIRLAEVPNRYLAGAIEVYLKAFVADKTAWQRMLKNEVDNTISLTEAKKELSDKLSDELRQYVVEENSTIDFNYPVLKFPEKIKSLSFDKEAVIEGLLTGIKGQYIMLDNEKVLNIRKHTGYYIIFKQD